MEKSKKFLPIAFVIAIVVLAGGIYLWLSSRNSVSTDDATIEGHVIPVNSRVAGQVIEVKVVDNQLVQKGDLLVVIDPEKYRIKTAQSRAEAAATKAQSRKAIGDAERAKQLYDKDQISKQVYEHALAEAEIARANADLSDKQMAAADLDLQDTQIVAPESGRIGRKNIENRSFVQVGQPLMAIVTPEVWVTANFKETQLAHMHPGQKVEIDVDAFPNQKFHGHIDSFQPGTGARFSLFPPENATGNFVKVVQRVPVKIVFDDPIDQLTRLAPGMSVTPVVDLK